MGRTVRIVRSRSGRFVEGAHSSSVRCSLMFTCASNADAGERARRGPSALPDRVAPPLQAAHLSPEIVVSLLH